LPDPADKSDLDKLGARLEAAKARHTPEPRDVAISALAQGTRHAFEIAATTIVGAGIGWMLDRWLQTGPWMFLLFLLLGTGALIGRIRFGGVELGAAAVLFLGMATSFFAATRGYRLVVPEAPGTVPPPPPDVPTTT
jgi:F0F1-type ATP synthase assembly protein I